LNRKPMWQPWLAKMEIRDEKCHIGLACGGSDRRYFDWQRLRHAECRLTIWLDWAKATFRMSAWSVTVLGDATIRGGSIVRVPIMRGLTTVSLATTVGLATGITAHQVSELV
jgi:hypothetical protein